MLQIKFFVVIFANSVNRSIIELDRKKCTQNLELIILNINTDAKLVIDYVEHIPISKKYGAVKKVRYSKHKIFCSK